MNMVRQLLISIFGSNQEASDEAHHHLEALHGDSALIRLACELRDLKDELAQLAQGDTSAAS